MRAFIHTRSLRHTSKAATYTYIHKYTERSQIRTTKFRSAQQILWSPDSIRH